MFTLMLLNNPPPESLKNQILQMVVDDFAELSPLPISTDNPLYPLYQYVIGYQIHLYLQRMDAQRADSPQLLLALNDQDPSQILGFALCLPFLHRPQAALLSYLNVGQHHRKQGIGRALIERALVLYPQTELKCVAGKVPFFEHFGFHALAAQDAQVLMSSVTEPCNALLALQDLEPIYRSKEVRDIHAYLVKTHGKVAMEHAETLRNQHFDALADAAKACINARQRKH